MWKSFPVAILLCLAGFSTMAAETKAPEAGMPPRQALLGVEASEQFDGSTLSRIIFHDNRRTFYFSPPAGCKVRSGDRMDLVIGRTTATISLTVPIAPAPGNESDAESTAAAKPGDDAKSDDPEILPEKVSGQAVKRSSVTYERETGRYVRTKFKSLGRDWQVELSVEGPVEEVSAVEKLLFDSLCSIGIQTEEFLQRVAKEKERQALSELVQREKAAARQIPAGRIRGKL